MRDISQKLLDFRGDASRHKLFDAYAVSKLQNVLFAHAFAARNPQIACVACHPGFVFTSVTRHLPLYVRVAHLLAVPFWVLFQKTPRQGAHCSLHCCLSPSFSAAALRCEARFVAVNCAALSQGLIESELFGHVKGAFTGAVAAKDGMLVAAHGGTLFLDEVGDMPLDTQAKLLRVLELREVTPVGGSATRKVDIRLVAATNRDLRKMADEGEFREDLLFRLQVVTVELPALRERAGDVPLLIDHFIGELATEHGRAVRGITPEARALLVRYDWPGNVRELRNAIENMVLLTRSDVLDEGDVPEHIKQKGTAGRSPKGSFDLAGHSLPEIERAAIAATLELVGGNRQKAAKMLGIGERTLYRKIKEYGVG